MYETVSSIVTSPIGIAGIAAGFMFCGVVVGIIWEVVKPSTAKTKKPVAPAQQHQNSNSQPPQNSAAPIKTSVKH